MTFFNKHKKRVKELEEDLKLEHARANDADRVKELYERNLAEAQRQISILQNSLQKIQGESAKVKREETEADMLLLAVKIIFGTATKAPKQELSNYAAQLAAMQQQSYRQGMGAQASTSLIDFLGLGGMFGQYR